MWKKISENENQNNNNTHKIAKRSSFESFSQPFIIQHLMVIYQNMSNSSHRFNGQKIWMNGGLPSDLHPPLSDTRSSVRPTLLAYIFFPVISGWFIMQPLMCPSHSTASNRRPSYTPSAGMEGEWMRCGDGTWITASRTEEKLAITITMRMKRKKIYKYQFKTEECNYYKNILTDSHYSNQMPLAKTYWIHPTYIPHGAIHVQDSCHTLPFSIPCHTQYHFQTIFRIKKKDESFFPLSSCSIFLLSARCAVVVGYLWNEIVNLNSRKLGKSIKQG